MSKPDLKEEIHELREQIDDVVDDLGKIIIEIAEHNEDFICTICLNPQRSCIRYLSNLPVMKTA